MNEEFEKFCQKYEARGRTSTQRYRKLIRLRPQDWLRPEDTVMPAEVEDLNYIEVLFTQEGIDRILAQERQYEDLMHRHNDIREHLSRQLAEDRIRHADPRVMKAYERYRLLLNLVKDTYK